MIQNFDESSAVQLDGKDLVFAHLSPADFEVELARIQRAAARKEVAGCTQGSELDVEGQGSKVRWVAPKRRERAIEKAVRSYGNDVSLLTDLARQSLVYETAEQLALALRAICQDPEVRVVRVKNRLTSSHDAHQTAGYRDVLINLTLQTANAVSLSQKAFSRVCFGSPTSYWHYVPNHDHIVSGVFKLFPLVADKMDDMAGRCNGISTITSVKYSCSCSVLRKSDPQ